MRNIKTPIGTVKKGIAHFGRTSASGALSIGNTGAVPIFESVLANTSSNINKISITQIKLKAGATYKLSSSSVVSITTVNDIVLRFYDVTNSTYIGTESYYGSAGEADNYTRNSDAVAVITPSVDVIIELRNAYSTIINSLYLSSNVVVEELEAYLIPTDPTKYTDVINYISSTGSVLIPSGLPVGTKKLIRKINSTAGDVNITCTGETFSSAGLTTLTLNVDGSFFELEKVSSTRWEVTGWGNQKLTNVASNRTLATTYTNTSGKPLDIIITHAITPGNSTQFFVDGVIISEYGNNTASNTGFTHSVSIPNGSTYKLSSAVIGTIVRWNEIK